MYPILFSSSMNERPLSIGNQNNYRILIPVYNEEKRLKEASKEKLDFFKRYKNDILFIDDGSTDRTIEFLQAYGFNIIPLKQHQRKMSAIYQVVQDLDCKFVFILDSDTYVYGDLENAIEYMNQRGIDALRVRITNQYIKNGHAKEWWEKILNEAEKIEGNVYNKMGLAPVLIHGACGIYRREVLSNSLARLKKNGLSRAKMKKINMNNIWNADDSKLSLQLFVDGCRVESFSKKSLIGITEAPKTLRKTLEQRFRWFEGFFELKKFFPTELLYVTIPANHGPVHSISKFTHAIVQSISSPNVRKRYVPLYVLGGIIICLSSFFINQIKNIR